MIAFLFVGLFLGLWLGWFLRDWHDNIAHRLDANIVPATEYRTRVKGLRNHEKGYVAKGAFCVNADGETVVDGNAWAYRMEKQGLINLYIYAVISNGDGTVDTSVPGEFNITHCRVKIAS